MPCFMTYDDKTCQVEELHFYPLQVVSRYRDPQLKVSKNDLHTILVQFESKHMPK